MDFVQGNSPQNASEPNDDALWAAAEDFQRIREVFESALEVPESERASYIANACGSHPQVFAAVHRMLAAHSRTFPLLDRIPQQPEQLQPGEKISDQFVVEGLLGEGGMGQVYRCRDTMLGRTVAVKVLPERIARNLDAIARFRREAQLLAALNHPNIAVIHNTAEINGANALVLEFIEGPTLADLIANGPIPVEQSLAMGRQIAEALETAHEAGITHCDLKPANVKVRADGAIKVLDFGLAMGRDAIRETQTCSNLDLRDPGMTNRPGLLGTAAYMSPEQARGEHVDKRSDIWAFGAVLYEMLSGRAPFARAGISETLRAVLQDEVDWTALPAETPIRVRKLIERCLERNRRRRLRDVGEARIALEDVATAGESRIRKPGRLYMLVAAALGGLAIFGGTLLLKHGPARPPATRLSILLPDGHKLFANRRTMAVSPDGRLIVYASPRGLRLRKLSALDFVTIRGTESLFDLKEPAFSPDGKWIAFHTSSDQTIQKIPVEGGTALKVCDAVYPSGLSWGLQGILYVEAGTTGPLLDPVRAVPRGGIVMVSPDGGTPKYLARTRNREVFQGPQLLPDASHLLFTLDDPASPDQWSNPRIVIQDLATGERQTILQGGADARYVSAGYLVYAVAGNLIAAPFDAGVRKVTGSAAPVIEGVQRGDLGTTGAAHYSVAANGTLVYVPGPILPSKELVITDRKGGRERLPLPAAMYDTPRVSPRGNQIAFGITENDISSIFIYDLSGQNAMRRLTLQGDNRLPAWSSDGTRIAYQSNRDGDRAIFCQRADGSGPVQRLTTPAQGEAHEPEAWSRGDKMLLFSNRHDALTSAGPTASLGDVVLSALSLRDGTVRAFEGFHSSTSAGATFSPDGNWVAYANTTPSEPGDPDAGGKTTIAVEPFPPTGAKYELTSDGKPQKPQWSRDGQELFFVPGPEQFRAVPVGLRPVFAFGRPVSLLLASSKSNTRKPRTYDVMPDGRFVGVFPRSDNSEQPIGDIVVVLNWFSELEARVPRWK